MPYEAAQLICSLKNKFHMWMPLLNQTNVCPTNSSSLRIRSRPSLLLLVVSELNNTQFWVNFSRSIKPPTWLWNWPLRYFWNCAAIELYYYGKTLKTNKTDKALCLQGHVQKPLAVHKPFWSRALGAILNIGLLVLLLVVPL